MSSGPAIERTINDCCKKGGSWYHDDKLIADAICDSGAFVSGGFGSVVTYCDMGLCNQGSRDAG